MLLRNDFRDFRKTSWRCGTIICGVHQRQGATYVTKPSAVAVPTVSKYSKRANILPQRHSEEIGVIMVCMAASLPTRATPGSAGLDIYAPHAFSLEPHQRAVIPTGLAIQSPPGTYLRLAPRSSLARKEIDIVGGVIDGDYVGELAVIVYNASCTQPFQYTPANGTPLCQAIITPYKAHVPVKVDEFFPTERGARSFGRATADSVTFETFRQELKTRKEEIRKEISDFQYLANQFRVMSSDPPKTVVREVSLDQALGLNGLSLEDTKTGAESEDKGEPTKNTKHVAFDTAPAKGCQRKEDKREERKLEEDESGKPDKDDTPYWEQRAHEFTTLFQEFSELGQGLTEEESDEVWLDLTSSLFAPTTGRDWMRPDTGDGAVARAFQRGKVKIEEVKERKILKAKRKDSPKDRKGDDGE